MSFHLFARPHALPSASASVCSVLIKSFFPLVTLQFVMSLFCSGAFGQAQPSPVGAGNSLSGVVCIRSSGAIAVRAKCKSNEKRLSAATLASLSVQGAPGPQGPQGLQGLQGPSGAPGLNAFDGIPSGKTVFGVIGGDFEAWDVGQTFFAYASLPSFAPVSLTGLTVTVANTSAVSDCSGVSCLSAEEQEQSSACQGSVSAPSASPGRVCIYPLYRANSVGVTGYAFSPSSSPGAGRFGFSVGWATENAGDTYLEAVWAYTAP